MELVQKKEIGLTVFVIIFSGALFAFIAMNNMSSGDPVLIVGLTMLLFPWVSFLAITLALVSKLYANICLLTITGIFILIGRGQIWAIVAALLFLLLSAIARLLLLRELNNRVEYHTRAVFYSGLKYIFMGVAILLVGLATPALTQSISTQNELIPAAIVRFILKPYQPYLQNAFPGVTVDTSLYDIVSAQLTAQVAANPDLTTLSTEERQLYIQQTTQQLSEKFNQDISSADNIVKVITDVTNNKIHTFSRYNPILTPIFIFVLVIIGAGLFIPWLATLALLLTAFMLYLSRKINFIQLVSLSRPVEKLEL